MNRIQKLLGEKSSGVLSIYYTAGYPEIDSTEEIALALDKAGADLIEIGIPFSDPVADGETIQKSNKAALENGITLNRLFEQLANIRSKTDIPVILMGYLNPVLQYGIENFCAKCAELGIDGTIIPDLPLELYLKSYREKFEKADLSNIFLVTPQTSDERIRLIDANTTSFIYAVSSAAVTGGEIAIEGRLNYLKRLNSLKLKNPLLVGFGISKNRDFVEINKHCAGAIIGSAFIRLLQNTPTPERASAITSFINAIRVGA